MRHWSWSAGAANRACSSAPTCATQAKQDRELLGPAKRCHPETLRKARCANTRRKESSAQVRVS
jgi:ssDNA-binding Zn-finger/Zn-ribbon topoisomerase 1